MEAASSSAKRKNSGSPTTMEIASKTKRSSSRKDSTPELPDDVVFVRLVPTKPVSSLPANAAPFVSARLAACAVICDQRHGEGGLAFAVSVKKGSEDAFMSFLMSVHRVPNSDVRLQASADGITDTDDDESAGDLDFLNTLEGLSDFEEPATTRYSPEPEWTVVTKGRASRSAKKSTTASPRKRSPPVRPAPPFLQPAQPIVAAELPSRSAPAKAAGQRPLPRGPAPRRPWLSAAELAQISVSLPIEAPELLTALFVPMDTTVVLKKVNSFKISKQLALLGEELEVRDLRNGGLAVDFPLSTPPDQILATTSLLDIPVSVSLPVGAVS